MPNGLRWDKSCAEDSYSLKLEKQWVKLVQGLESIPGFPVVICEDGQLVNQSMISLGSHGFGLTPGHKEIRNQKDSVS